MLSSRGPATHGASLREPGLTSNHWPCAISAASVQHPVSMLSAAFSGLAADMACPPSCQEGGNSSKVLAEYIWLGRSSVEMQSRTIVLDARPLSVEELPCAEIDGSSYGHAPAESCEVYLQPRRIFPDPFRGGDHILVLCDTYVPPLLDVPEALHHLKAHPTNRRPACEAVMQQASSSAPMFSMVQGYTLQEPHIPAFLAGSSPSISASSCSFAPMPARSGGGGGRCSSYMEGGSGGCSKQRLGREVSELHMQACLKAGIHYGSSAAVRPDLWTYKVGPCAGLDMADQLSVSRYCLQRAAEAKEACLCYPLEPLPGDWGGSCCQVEFSTAAMRCTQQGMAAVHAQLARLQGSHAQHVIGYCGGGLQRLLSHKAGGTAFQRAMQFSVGVGNKNAAVMIPTSTVLGKAGPLMDRRPPSDCDPYMATLLLACTSCDIPCPVNLMQTAPFALAGAGGGAGAPLRGGAAKGGGFGGGCWRGLGGAGCREGSGVLPSSHNPTDSCLSASLSRASDSLDSLARLSSGTTSSEELLISELDKLDGFVPHTPPMAMAGMSCSVAEDACSEVCSDASSPPQGPSCLADADQEMFYE